MVFEAVLDLLAEFGFFRVVLPFLLIFAIFYAVIYKTGILGKPGDPWTRNIAAIISLVAAFLVISYTPVVEALAVLIPHASFLLVVTMLFLMLLAFIVPKWEEKVEKASWWWILAAIVLFVIFLAIVGTSVGERVPALYAFAQFMMGEIPIELGPETTNMLIGLAIIIGIPILVIALIVLGAKKAPEEEFKLVKK